MYPYNDKTPEKDYKKVWCDLVMVSSKREKKKLLDWAVNNGYSLCSQSLYDGDGFYTIAIPFDKDRTIGYISLSLVKADLVYRGAKLYKAISDFLKQNNEVCSK
jgi:hypothetical protein